VHKLADGASRAELIEAYPHLTEDDILAALAYAADALERQRVAGTVPRTIC
jgi:uncharacterized protein (DUF433 family)